MKRTILLTAAVAVLALNDAMAGGPGSYQGRIPLDVLAQFGPVGSGAGNSLDHIPDDVLAHFGVRRSESGRDKVRPEVRKLDDGQKKEKVSYKLEIKNLSRKGKLRRVSRRTTRKNSVRLERQKKGVNSVRYRAKSTSSKATSSRSSYSGANRFAVR